MKKTNILSLTFLFFSAFVFSQSILESKSTTKIVYNDNGIVQFASFEKAKIPKANAKLLLLEALKLNDLSQLALIQTENDIWGGQHDIYKQYFNTIEVKGRTYRVHYKNNYVTAINGNFSPIDLPLNTSNLKTEAQILEIGLSNLGANYSLPLEFQNGNTTGSLVVLPASISRDKKDHYAYAFNLFASNPFAAETIYFDAISGSVLLKDAIIKHINKPNEMVALTKLQEDYLKQEQTKNKAYNNTLFKNSFRVPFVAGTADTKYSGNQSIETKLEGADYVLRDDVKNITTRNSENGDVQTILFAAILFGMDAVENDLTVDFVDNDNDWTTAEHETNKDDAAIDVHWGIGELHDFWLNTYSRNSFDGQGAKTLSLVHVGTEFVNAAWLGLSASEGCMLYGDGNYDANAGTGFVDALVSLDVTAHELGHAIDGAEGDLTYERESGAIDEGLADIWGAVIEANVKPNGQRWTIGEEILVNNPPIQALRSLSNPNMFNQPDTYGGTFWQDVTDAGCPTPDAETNDNCGVHINSGVLNYWFYLLTEGGSGTNDNSDAFSVNGIGMQKAADITYLAETTFIHSETTFDELKDFTLQAATDLYGAGAPEILEVRKAWCAVGVDADCATLSVDDFATNKDFFIYPNPVSNIINIANLDQTENPASFNITNILGQTVMQGVVTSKSINVDNLQSGVYILTLKNEDAVLNHKFVKE